MYAAGVVLSSSVRQRVLPAGKSQFTPDEPALLPECYREARMGHQ